MSSGILALRGNSNTQRLRGPLVKKRSQDKKVLARNNAKNNAIFVKGNSLPHALTFEMYEDNVRDNLYTKNQGRICMEDKRNMNHSSACKCTYCLDCLEDKMDDLQLVETQETKDCLNINLQATIDFSSINNNSHSDGRDSEDSQGTNELSSSNSIEALVNYYTLRYQHKTKNITEENIQMEKNCDFKYYTESPLVSDEFGPQDIDRALILEIPLCTSTPKPSSNIITRKNVAEDIFPDNYEEYSVNELSESLLNNNNMVSVTATGAENPNSKVRVLVGLVGRCKLIDCNLNDDNIPHPQYRKYTPQRSFNPKSSAVAALKIQSPQKISKSSPIF